MVLQGALCSCRQASNDCNFQVTLRGMNKLTSLTLIALSIAGCSAVSEESSEALDETIAVIESGQRGGAKITMTAACSIVPVYGRAWVDIGFSVGRIYDDENRAKIEAAYENFKDATNEYYAAVHELLEQDVRFPSDNPDYTFVGEMNDALLYTAKGIETASETSVRFGHYKEFGGYFDEGNIEDLEEICERVAALQIN